MDAAGELMTEILTAVSMYAPSALEMLKLKLSVVMNGYTVNKNSGEMVVYTGTKNVNLLKRFLLAKSISGRSQRTIKMYETSIRKVLTEIGKDADTITGDDINLWIAQELLAGKTKVSTDNYRRAISSFFDWLTKNDFIQKNPMNKVEVIKPEKKEKKAFTEIECARIRNACRNAREKAIVEMLFSTGCRVSELISIKTDDIHDGKVDILGKGAKWRTVFLNAEAQIAIESYMAERSDGNEYLFAGGKFQNAKTREKKSAWYRYKECVDETEHLRDSSVEDMIRKIGKRAGVKNAHPHRFRRTCATFALKRGMGVELVSKMLGHANIQTTQIYLDIGEEELENAHKKFVV